MTHQINYDETDSTNEAAKRFMAQDGHYESGVVITAKRQSQGRGTKDRQWVSEPGGLYMSVLRPPIDLALSNPGDFVIKVAQKVIEVLKHQTQVQAEIEWPNDLLLRDRKLGGILCESRWSRQEHKGYVIIGIGVNVNQDHFPSPIDKVAISLSQHTGQVYDLDTLISSISKELLAW